MKHHYPDRYSDLDSPLHRLDPRSKLFGFTAAILIIVSEPRGMLVPFFFILPSSWRLSWSAGCLYCLFFAAV